MLKTLGYPDLDAFVAETIPKDVRINELTDVDGEGGIRPYSELELRRRAEEIAGLNKPMKSYIGMGYVCVRHG
jgi:glycine dehydrogenase